VAPGTVLTGRYRLDAQLASGGMAQVWRGTDEVLRRSVAVKILHPHLAADETFVARFRQEAIAVAKLSHPAIVSVYDTCSDNGVQAIVMELVRGQTLRHRLDAGSLEPWLAANVAAQVAGALDVAHQSGLVHRDIKPANILISEDGRVKVGDFGIAKAAEANDLTQEGSFIGTAKYLAPEQVEGGGVDGRTDLYSLGVVLYEMLCGRVPFEGDSSSATALARLHQDPRRPRLVRADIPAELEAVTMTLLEREPDRRYPNATAARSALLEAVGTELPPVEDPTTTITPLPLAPPPAPPAPPGPYDSTRVGTSTTDRNWVLPSLLVALAAASLIIAIVLISRSGNAIFGDDPADSEEPEQAEPVDIPIVNAKDFDPLGDDKVEYPHAVGNVFDKQPVTFWQTEHYGKATPLFNKDGVGIYVSLASTADLQELKLTSDSKDWIMDVYVMDGTPDPNGDLDDWGSPVAHVDKGTAGENTIPLADGTRGEAVLLWFTGVGSEPLTGGQWAGRHIMTVNELEVLGKGEAPSSE
jgi:serine/threonine protein kinase